MRVKFLVPGPKGPDKMYLPVFESLAVRVLTYKYVPPFRRRAGCTQSEFPAVPSSYRSACHGTSALPFARQDGFFVSAFISAVGANIVRLPAGCALRFALWNHSVCLGRVKF
jgi:hypothetical protein